MGIIDVLNLDLIYVLFYLCILKPEFLIVSGFFYVLSPRSKRKPVQNGLSTGQLKVITYDSYYAILIFNAPDVWYTPPKGIPPVAAAASSAKFKVA